MRGLVVFAFLCATALAAPPASFGTLQQQIDRQSADFNAELGLGALGNAAVGGEVNLPTWFKPVVMGLGVMSLANTAWTAAQPYLANQAVAEEKRMTELKGLKDQIEKLNKENAALKKGKEQPKEKPQEKPKHLTL